MNNQSRRAEIDFKLAWRWLLPSFESKAVSIHGFIYPERHFLEEVVTEQGGSVAENNADVYILDASFDILGTGSSFY